MDSLLARGKVLVSDGGFGCKQDNQWRILDVWVARGEKNIKKSTSCVLWGTRSGKGHQKGIQEGTSAANMGEPRRKPVCVESRRVRKEI